MELMCDYLIIGGGSAGCVVASRLAAWTRANIILLEAGQSDENDPATLQMSQLERQDERYDWGYTARTTDGGGTIAYSRAKVLGGCANHNDCAFIAPPPSDLDRWEALGATGWNAETLAPALNRVAQKTTIESSPEGNALSRAFIDGAKQLGLPELNFREGVATGAGWFPLNTKGDFRQSSSVAYLHPISQVPNNLRVLTGVMATSLVIVEGKAVAAETTRGRILASREIILCGGSINTPQLLMLSGIGPAPHLRSHGIEVVKDVPGVGQNLMDHVAATVAYALKQPTPHWTRTPCESTVLLKIDPNAPAPDVLFHFVLRLREKYVGKTQFGGIQHGVKLSPNVARPKSRGSLMLRSPSPHDHPLIDLNYFSDAEDYDRRVLMAGLRWARRLAETPALVPWLGREVAPGPLAQSDDEIFAYVKETCETVYHPCGTCRMGAAADRMSVVTPDLRVKGIAGLRIADASIFPDMITVNINNTVMMVAEQAASIIAGKMS